MHQPSRQMRAKLRDKPGLAQSFGLACAAAVALFCAGGCDTVPGVADDTRRPPVISELVFTPTIIDLSSIPSSAISGDFVEFELSIGATVVDPDGDLRSVAFVLQPPTVLSEPAAAGVLSNVSGDRFSYVETISLPIGQVGNYTVLVFADDEEGQLSNDVRGLLTLRADEGFGSPPTVERVDAIPEVLTPPTTLKIVATVTDPEGLPNILRVIITTPAGDDFAMVDDGESLGDDEADDGMYTATFDVPAGVEPGVQVFKVQAFDRNGNESAIVERPVTIQ